MAWLLDLLSEKGRARLKLRNRERFIGASWDFYRIKQDDKQEKKLKNKREEAEKEIQEGIEFFDADETVLALQERIDIFLKEHKLLREMAYFVDTEEFRLVDKLSHLRHRLVEYNHHHNSVEVQGLIKELDKKIHDLQQIINAEKQRARDLEHDRNHWRDRSILPFMMIYHKIRRRAKEGKKNAKKLNKVQSHIEKALVLLDKGKIKDVAQTMRNLHNELNLEEKEMIEEIKDLAQIEQFITVLQFREGEEDIMKVLENLRNIHFPKIEREELEEQMRVAHAAIEELHRKERFETKVLATEAQHIA